MEEKVVGFPISPSLLMVEEYKCTNSVQASSPLCHLHDSFSRPWLPTSDLWHAVSSIEEAI